MRGVIAPHILLGANMKAKVKDDIRHKAITACGGIQFNVVEFIDVPKWAEAEAKRNPYLEIEVIKLKETAVEEKARKAAAKKMATKKAAAKAKKASKLEKVPEPIELPDPVRKPDPIELQDPVRKPKPANKPTPSKKE